MPSLLKTIGKVNVWREDNALVYIAGMTIDADGDEMAYAPAGSNLAPLDHLGNAGETGNWWGITTDSNGQPHIQQPYHLAPGYYVSCTALEDSRFPESNPQRFLDSSQIPFFVLPGGFGEGAKLGDYGVGYNTKTGDNNAMIYADIGPKGQLGEGSIALARTLGLNPDAKKGGTQNHIICYWFMPGSGQGWQPVDVWWPAALNLFKAWGGLAKLQKVIKEIS
jgi:hypothetical protein